jgi:SAM-dependent methyltransferase
VKSAIEPGCGFGDFTARLQETGVKVVGLDISQTAIAKTRKRHPDLEFLVASILEHGLIKRLSPDVIVMAEINWYVLEQLRAFIEFLKPEMANVYLIHLLRTYAPGVEECGHDCFTDIECIMQHFGFE